MRRRPFNLMPLLLVLGLFLGSVGGYWLWFRFGRVVLAERSTEPRGDALTVLAPIDHAPGTSGPAPAAVPSSGPGAQPPPVLGSGPPPTEVPVSGPGTEPATPAPDPRPSPGDDPGPTAEELLARARAAEAAGDLTGALQAWQAIAAVAPSPEVEGSIRRIQLEIQAREFELRNRRAFQALMEEGEGHEAAGRYEQALASFEKAAQHVSSTEAAAKERLDRAVDRTRKKQLANLDSRDFEGFRARAREAFEAGRWVEADDAFQKARFHGKLSSEEQGRASVARQRRLQEGMVRVPGGEFLMGNGTDASDGPPRRCQVRSFFIDVHEVTNAEYRRFLGDTGRAPPPTWNGNAFPEGQASFPVTGVSWHDAVAYAAWAGKRLPTEEEWERAARGTDGRLYPWGSEFQPGKANSNEEKIGGPTKVGEYAQGVSQVGCHDMVGNVLEWTATEIRDPDGRSYRVMKGGCWYFEGKNCRTSKRFKTDPSSALRSNGFRCARDAE